MPALTRSKEGLSSRQQFWDCSHCCRVLNPLTLFHWDPEEVPAKHHSCKVIEIRSSKPHQHLHSKLVESREVSFPTDKKPHRHSHSSWGPGKEPICTLKIQKFNYQSEFCTHPYQMILTHSHLCPGVLGPQTLSLGPSSHILNP